MCCVVYKSFFKCKNVSFIVRKTRIMILLHSSPVVFGFSVCVQVVVLEVRSLAQGFEHLLFCLAIANEHEQVGDPDLSITRVLFL